MDNNNKYKGLVEEIEIVMTKYGFESIDLIQLSFDLNNLNELKGKQENEVRPSRCRLVRDPETGNWKVICD
ncbi:hypothetical protein GWK10_05150 [Spongiivirga citrea]|uniref:Uncharacterized protein n=2 Tax=Spongiivirga citrea TaxID=1481457 RepID=A0A6M0CFI2_9FLAO|nr:hypothetical protein [Spongiivirga citrea]